MLAAIAALVTLSSCKKAADTEAVEDKATTTEQAAGEVKEAAEVAADTAVEAVAAQAAETAQEWANQFCDSIYSNTLG